MSDKATDDVLDNPEAHELTKPRDKAWENWAKWNEVGEEVKGYIRDVFFRPAEGDFPEQRGITLEQKDGTLINVGIKRKPFILNKTDDLRLGDPLVMRFSEEKPPQQKGYSPTKIFSFYGKNLEENQNEKTVQELEQEDAQAGGTVVKSEEDEQAEQEYNKTTEEQVGSSDF